MPVTTGEPRRSKSAEPKQHSSYTSYDIWCAGTTAATFPVVAGSEDAYARLLLCMRGIKNPYRSHHEFSGWGPREETQQLTADRENMRRRMNPGVSSLPVHHENYIQLSPRAEEESTEGIRFSGHLSESEGEDSGESVEGDARVM